jgi:hypothetical protein
MGFFCDPVSFGPPPELSLPIIQDYAQHSGYINCVKKKSQEINTYCNMECIRQNCRQFYNLKKMDAE